MLAESAAASVVCRSCCTMVHEEEQGRAEGWKKTLTGGPGVTERPKKNGCDSKFENKVFPMSKNRQNLT